MLNENIIKALEEKGFKRWTKGDMDRLYINPQTALNFEYDTNKSGHVSGAYLDGERISNSRGAALVNSKTYIDIATGEVVSNHDRMREAAREIMDAVTAEIEQAEVAEITATVAASAQATTDEEYDAIEEAYNNAHNDELIAAKAAGNHFPKCHIIRYCVENRIALPDNMVEAMEIFNKEFNRRWNMREYYNLGWGNTWHSVMNDWRDGKLA